jgi:hypothetical protein
MASDLTWQLHGIPSKMRDQEVPVNEILYADDTALLSNGKESLTTDLKLIRGIFTEFCMTMHEGTHGGNPSKTECTFFCKQPARYEDNTTRDGADTSPIKLDTASGAFIPFVKCFKYLGAIFTDDLDDMVEVDARILKASRIFDQY